MHLGIFIQPQGELSIGIDLVNIKNLKFVMHVTQTLFLKVQYWSILSTKRKVGASVSFGHISNFSFFHRRLSSADIDVSVLKYMQN